MLVQGMARTEEESTAQLSCDHQKVAAVHCAKWFCSVPSCIVTEVTGTDSEVHTEGSGIQLLSLQKRSKTVM